MASRPQITTKLRSAADWPQWLDQAQAVVKLLELEEYVDLEGTKETKDITEPDEPEIPEYPEGENVPQTRWETYDRLMIRYQVEQRSYDRKKHQFDKLKEKHKELLSALQQSISDEVGLEKSSTAASQPTTLVMKVKELLRIDDERTIQGFEEKWQQALERDLKKVSLEAWRDEVIRSTKAMRAWKSPLAEKWRPHILVVKNLARYYPAGAQRAQAVIDDSIKAGTAPDFELFVIEITDFIAKVGGTSSRPPRVFSTTFQGHDEEELGPNQQQNARNSPRKCKACSTKGHQVNSCYTLRDIAEGREPRSGQRLKEVKEWLKDPKNREKAEKLYPKLSQEAPMSIGSVKGITVGAAYTGIENPTKNSIIIDSGADGHVFNDFERFIEYEEFEQPMYALAGDSTMPILGRGTARIIVKGVRGKPRVLHARNVYYSPDFHTNAISKSK